MIIWQKNKGKYEIADIVITLFVQGIKNPFSYLMAMTENLQQKIWPIWHEHESTPLEVLFSDDTISMLFMELFQWHSGNKSNFVSFVRKKMEQTGCCVIYTTDRCCVIYTTDCV